MATDSTIKSTQTVRRLPFGHVLSAAVSQSFLSLWLPSALLFLGTLALYWKTHTDANTFDAVSYANQIARLYPRTGDLHWLFHPHHLLFNALGFLIWRIARDSGYVGGSLVTIQRTNAVLGAAGIVIYYVTLRQLLQRSRWLPLLVALGLAFSFGYWICATDGRVNMPSIVLLLAAFSALCRVTQTPQPRFAAWAGLFAGLAVLFHESAGLFVVVGLAGMMTGEDDPLLLPDAMRQRRRQMVAAFLGIWAVTVVLPYVAVGVGALHLHSVGAFRHWMSSYSELGWWWDFRILHNLRLDAYAIRHAAFVEPAGKQGTFHLSDHASAGLRALYFATLIGWFIAVYAFFAALPLLWRSHMRRTMIVCVLWIVVYAAFFTVWSPGYFVFWVPVLVPTGVMLALALAHYRARHAGVSVNWLVGLWIALFTVVNYQIGIAPHLEPNSDPFRRIAADVRAHTHPGDIVVVAGAGDAGPCEVALPYFADRDVVSLHTILTRAHDDKPLSWAVAQGQIAQALSTGHAVYALDELWHNPHTFTALQERHGISRDDLRTLFTPYRRTLAWNSPRGPVWQLTPMLMPIAPTTSQ